MATKPKSQLVRCNGTMNESQFLGWVRSALRSKSLKWPPRAKALELARRKYVGPNKLQKWEYCCSICGQWHKAKDVIVDHHPVAAGSILSVADIGPFANNLYCEVDNLRVLDKVCHDIHTLSEYHKISWEEASVLKDVIAYEKSHNTQQIVALLVKEGYTEHSNAQKRRKSLTELFTKKAKEKEDGQF